GAIFGTVALGGLLGFLIPTVIAEYNPSIKGPAAAGAAAADTSNTELPVARAFIDAFVSNDQQELRALGVDELVAVKANDLAAQVSHVDRPVLLGVASGPGVSFQAYAAHVTMNDGSQTVLSWRVATSSGRVTLIPPAPAMPASP
ncbi:MAG TPA: hypothetical protein VFP22_11920, partial [Candidatus Limnocylindrales bacterium]|nr:hypothetical protein [Candidatus Limnocylindrales bacterium]